MTFGIYRHYSGNWYVAVGTGRHSETLEESVIYVRVKDRSVWIRPAGMFFSDVLPGTPRFHRLRAGEIVLDITLEILCRLFGEEDAAKTQTTAGKHTTSTISVDGQNTVH